MVFVDLTVDSTHKLVVKLQKDMDGLLTAGQIYFAIIPKMEGYYRRQVIIIMSDFKPYQLIYSLDGIKFNKDFEVLYSYIEPQPPIVQHGGGGQNEEEKQKDNIASKFE